MCVCMQCISVHYMIMHFSISFNRFHTCIVDVATIIHYKYGWYYVKYVCKYHPYHIISYFYIFLNMFHLFLLQGTYWGLNHVTTFFKWILLMVLLQFWSINLWTLWTHDSTHLFFFTWFLPLTNTEYRINTFFNFIYGFYNLSHFAFHSLIDIILAYC